MPRIFLHFGKFPIASKMLTSSVLTALLMTLNTTVIAQPSITPTQTPSQPSLDINPIGKKLLGQWQTKDPSSSATLVTFLFTPENKLFLIFPDANGSVAVELQYRINSTTKPMNLDITIPSSKEPVLTIFEFTADGKLRLQITDTAPGKPRPTAFSSQASLLTKASDATTLPENSRIIDPKAETPGSSQSRGEAQVYIATINRGQQAYYLEKGKFGNTIQQLEIGIKPETENYRYRIVNLGKGNQTTISTATAKKPELKSYTGVVFVRRVQGETVTNTAICETDKPSSKPPATPKIPLKESQQVQCPAGSHLL